MNPTDIRHHGVTQFQHNSDEDDSVVEEMRRTGYAVIPSELSASELATIAEKLDVIYETQVAEVGGEAVLRAIHDADVARCTIEYDDYFVELAAHARLLEIGKRFFGAPFILMAQNGIINRSHDEHYQLTWHRDLNYQHFVSSRPLAMSALFCIDAFSELTGGTAVLPGSHASEAFPSEDFIRKHQITVDAPAGSIIVFDSMLFHRSGFNQSGRTRRGVNLIYALPLIKQQIEFPRVLNGKFRDDPVLGPLLGYSTEPGESVISWRKKKIGLAESRLRAAERA